MLPLQDHGNCKKVQLREFAAIESVGAFKACSYFVLLEDKQSF